MALQEERVQVVQDVGRIASSSLVHLEYAPKADLHTLPLVLPQPPRVMLARFDAGSGVSEDADSGAEPDDGADAHRDKHRRQVAQA